MSTSDTPAASPRVSDEQLAQLAVEIPDPVCRVCGGEMVIGSIGGGLSTSWSCATARDEWVASGVMGVSSPEWKHLRDSMYDERRNYTTVDLAFDLQACRAELAAVREEIIPTEAEIEERVAWLLSINHDQGVSSTLAAANRHDYAKDVANAQRSLRYWLASQAAWERIAALAAVADTQEAGRE